MFGLTCVGQSFSGSCLYDFHHCDCHNVTYNNTGCHVWQPVGLIKKRRDNRVSTRCGTDGTNKVFSNPVVCQFVRVVFPDCRGQMGDKLRFVSFYTLCRR